MGGVLASRVVATAITLHTMLEGSNELLARRCAPRASALLGIRITTKDVRLGGIHRVCETKYSCGACKHSICRTGCALASPPKRLAPAAACTELAKRSAAGVGAAQVNHSLSSISERLGYGRRNDLRLFAAQHSTHPRSASSFVGWLAAAVQVFQVPASQISAQP